MSPLEYIFDKIIVIGLARRTDRRALFIQEMAKLGVKNFEWFDGYDKPVDHNGQPSGNKGCSESHRAVLDTIVFNKWRNAVVFEDDAMVRPQFIETFNQIFLQAMSEVPAGAKIIYLGGGYGCNPVRRIGPCVIEIRRMLTTSSYIITGEMAREMAPHISGVGPIDNLFNGFTEKGNCYCIQPRLFVQRETLSDLTDQTVNYEGSMTDAAHEEMLLEGTVTKLGDDYVLSGKLQRRELAAPHDMDNTEVIVDDKLYRIASLQLPDHRAPWFRGEPVTYFLKQA